MFLDYLKKNYKVNEPIFASDIDLPVSNTSLRQMLKNLCDKGKLFRYEPGIYYLKGESRLKGGTLLSAQDVARYKYVSRNNKTDGYYSGYTFANLLGLTTQVPYTIEIVSNQASAKFRQVNIKNQQIILRRPKTTITNENSSVLQLLDLLKDFDLYIDNEIPDAQDKVRNYAKKIGIRKSDVDQYIGLYPDTVYKYIYKMRLYDVFA